MTYDFDVLPDDIWDSADPRAWELLKLILDGRELSEAERIIDATWDGADPLHQEVGR